LGQIKKPRVGSKMGGYLSYIKKRHQPGGRNEKKKERGGGGFNKRKTLSPVSRKKVRAGGKGEVQFRGV